MRLWTWHKQDFSLIKGKVYHVKSDYHKTVQDIVAAYRKLHHRIGTDQVIWCFLRREDHVEIAGAPEIEWELEVPDNCILCFVDNIVWNKILCIRCTVPSAIRHQWFAEALRREPGDIDKRHQIEQQLKDEFWKQESPEVLWDKLILSKPSEATVSACAVLRHPVPREWVVKSQL